MESKAYPEHDAGIYRLLRRLFMAGCILNIVLTFVPTVRIKTAPWHMKHLENGLFSSSDLMRFTFETGQIGLGLLLLILFSAYIALLLLAIFYQRRWVFIVGASYTTFLILMGLFSSSDPDLELLLIPRIIGYIATLLMLSGFFAKPPIDITSIKMGNGNARKSFSKYKYCTHCGSKNKLDSKFCIECGNEIS